MLHSSTYVLHNAFSDDMGKKTEKRHVFEVCRQKYYESLGKLKALYDEGGISFLEYQALSFKAIDDTMKWYKESTGRYFNQAERVLISEWAENDPVLSELPLRKIYLSRVKEKLKLIGECLLQEFLKKGKPKSA